MSATEKAMIRFILRVLDQDKGIGEKAYLAFHTLTNAASGEFVRALVKIGNCIDGTDGEFYLPEGTAHDLLVEFMAL